LWERKKGRERDERWDPRGEGRVIASIFTKEVQLANLAKNI
jgi:hypothetical protein